MSRSILFHLVIVTLAMILACSNEDKSASSSLPVEISTPEKAAKALYETLMMNDLVTAKKYLITRNEASVVGAEFANKISGRIDRLAEHLEELAQMLQGSTWVGLEISEKETYRGTRGIAMTLTISLSGQNGTIGFMFWEIKEGYWKLMDI